MTRLKYDGRTTPHLIESLYVEAMLLADEARGYFDGPGRLDRERMSPMGRVTFSCESLRVTTRLMHVIAWLLTRKAIDAGDMELAQAQRESLRLAEAAGVDPGSMAMMPIEARALIDASIDLYARVGRIDREMHGAAEENSPARRLLHRLEQSF